MSKDALSMDFTRTRADVAAWSVSDAKFVARFGSLWQARTPA